MRDLPARKALIVTGGMSELGHRRGRLGGQVALRDWLKMFTRWFSRAKNKMAAGHLVGEVSTKQN